MAGERRDDEMDKREEGEGDEERGEVGREGSEPCVKGVGGERVHGVVRHGLWGRSWLLHTSPGSLGAARLL